MRLHTPLALIGLGCLVVACGPTGDRPPVFTQAGGAAGGAATGSGGTWSSSGVGGSQPSFTGDPRMPKCGDGILDQGEECDDHNWTSRDGCNGVCRKEAGYECPTPGQPCISTVSCGDGSLGGTEECDDHGTEDGDGCSHDCKLEEGWRCPMPGKRCVPVCGDGVITGPEKCDDGDQESGDGCSSTCIIEPGFSCNTPGEDCVESKCGNKSVEAG
jgi:cysteine-rich repeat protein